MRTGANITMPIISPAWIFGLLTGILLLGSANFLSAQISETETQENPSLTKKEIAEAPPLPPNAKMSYEQREIEKVKLYFGIVAMFLSGFVILVAIITVMRRWRCRREKAQLGQKQPATEVIDAWSRYKLPEETDDTSAG